MKKCILWALCLLLGAGFAQAQDLPAFPGAEGFGKYALGVRGAAAGSRQVYHVTNLNNSGAGSLRDALSQPGRIVVFDVSGVIKINSILAVPSNTYIAGQTAPGDGVIVYGHRVSCSGATNVIVRHMRFYNGVKGGEDSFGLSNGENMCFDHLSLLWANDETFSMNDDGKGIAPGKVTLQNSILGQGLVPHSAGGLLRSENGVSVIRSIYIHNNTRNPNVRKNIQFINNVVYNWGTDAWRFGTDGERANAWVEGNYFISGRNNGTTCYAGASATHYMWVGANPDYSDTNRDGVLNGTALTSAAYGSTNKFASLNAFRAALPNPCPEWDNEVYPIMTAPDALNFIIEKAGASLPVRSDIDKYLIEDLLRYGGSNSLRHIAEEATNGIYQNVGLVNAGTKKLDTDNDGIPDEWEDANGLDKNSAADAVAVAANGYLNIENYVNGIAAPAEQPWARAIYRPQMASRTVSSISLTWKNNEGGAAATGITLQRQKDGESSWTDVATLDADATSHTASGLDEDSFYSFRWITNTSAGNATSETLRVSTEGTPAAPLACNRAIEPAHLGRSKYYTAVEFIWENETGDWSRPITFDVYLGTSADALTKINTAPLSSPVFNYTPATPLDMNAKYYWRVDASNAHGTATGPVWEFNASGFSFTSNFLDVGQNYNKATAARVTATSGTILPTGSSQNITVDGNTVNFSRSSGTAQASGSSDTYRSGGDSYSQWRLTASGHYVDIAPSNDKAKAGFITRVTLNGTDADPGTTSRAMPVILFSDRVPFDANRILDYAHVTLSKCRGFTSGNAIHTEWEDPVDMGAPVGTKSVRVQYTVRLNEVFGLEEDGVQYAVHSSGDINLQSNIQSRLTYFGVTLEHITDDGDNGLSTNARIASATIDGKAAVVDNTGNTITLTLPHSQGPKGVFPVVFTTQHNGATADFVSGTSHDFAQGPLTITVTAQDEVNIKAFLVDVVVLPASSVNRISSLTINGKTAAVNNTTNTITCMLPNSDGPMRAFPVVFTLEDGNASASFVSGNSHDFSSPLSLQVTAEDGAVRTYTVTCTINPSTNKQLALVTATGTQAAYDTKLLQAFEDFDVTYLLAENSTPANVATLYADYDLIVLHSNVDGQNATAMAVRNLVGVKPILNLKAYFYSSGRWSWGTPNNAGIGEITASVPTAVQNHPIFDGVTFAGENLTYYGEPTTAVNGIQYATALDGSNFNATLRAANHVLATYGASNGVQMHEVNLNNAAKYLLVGLSYEGDSYLKFNSNTVTLLRNAANYLANPSAWYDYDDDGPPPPPVDTLSDVATIASLTVESVEADINQATGAITCGLPSVSGALTVAYVLDDPKATASFVNGGKFNFLGGLMPLSITVTAENGVTKKIYTVTVSVATPPPPPPPPLSDDADLSSLEVSEGTLTPSFNPDSLSYAVDVEHTVSSITITAVANDTAASVSGEGEKQLSEGSNPFDVVVTAEDGTTTKTYTITVTVAAAPPQPTSAEKNEVLRLWYSNGTLYNPDNESVTVYASTGAVAVRSEGEATLNLSFLPQGVYIAKTAGGKVLKFVR